MSAADTSPEQAPEAKKPWFEPASAILMAVASLLTAWCSYQSSCWSGQSSAMDTHGDKLARQALAWHMEALQIESIHTRLVMEALDAHMEGDEKRSRFYSDRFSDELKPAYEKWISLKPFENPAAPPHPFVRDLYTPRFDEDIRNAHAESAQAAAQSNTFGQTASTYLSNTVILATVLFFAGTAGKFDQRRVRWASLGFAIVLFLYAAIQTVLLPVS